MIVPPSANRSQSVGGRACLIQAGDVEFPARCNSPRHLSVHLGCPCVRSSSCDAILIMLRHDLLPAANERFRLQLQICRVNFSVASLPSVADCFFPPARSVGVSTFISGFYTFPVCHCWGRICFIDLRSMNERQQQQQQCTYIMSLFRVH